MCYKFSKYIVNRDSSIIGQFGHRLKPAPNTQGYMSLKMTNDDGELINVTVHRLVASIYLGLNYSDSDSHVDHIDGDKLNNHASNLRIVTNAENAKLYRKLKNSHIPLGHAECKKCNVIKHKSEFDKSSRNASGCQSYCKTCRKVK